MRLFVWRNVQRRPTVLLWSSCQIPVSATCPPSSLRRKNRLSAAQLRLAQSGRCPMQSKLRGDAKALQCSRAAVPRCCTAPLLMHAQQHLSSFLQSSNSRHSLVGTVFAAMAAWRNAQNTTNNITTWALVATVRCYLTKRAPHCQAQHLASQRPSVCSLALYLQKLTRAFG